MLNTIYQSVKKYLWPKTMKHLLDADQPEIRYTTSRVYLADSYNKVSWTYKFTFKSDDLRDKFLSAIFRLPEQSWDQYVLWKSYLPWKNSRGERASWEPEASETIIEAAVLIPEEERIRFQAEFSNLINKLVLKDDYRKDCPSFRKFSVGEKYYTPLYDRITTEPGKDTYTFFEHSLGSLDPVSGITKTRVQTNADQSGSNGLPYPKNFEIQTVKLIFGKDSDTGRVIPSGDAIKTINNSSWFRLFIGSRDYLVANSFWLINSKENPCCSDCKEASTQTVQVTCGRPDQSGIYVLAEPIDLIPGQSYRAELNFPQDKLKEKVDVAVYFGGYWKRIIN